MQDKPGQPDDECHLVSLCRGHRIDTRAGACWATGHRDLERAYLDGLYGKSPHGR